MDADPYKYFKIEGPELLEQLNRGALQLQRGEAPRDVVPVLLRHAHTLKGAARIVRCVDIAKQAHQLEDLLSLHREAQHLPPESTLVEEALGVLTAIGVALDALFEPQRGPTPASGGANTPRVDAPEVRTLRADVQDVDELTRTLGQAIAEQQRLRSAVEDLQSLRHSLGLLTRQLEAGRSVRSVTPHWWDTLSERSEDVTGALGRLEKDLDDASSTVAAHLDSMRQRVEAMRLVPAGQLFTALERAALDAALTLHKRVNVTMSGGHHRIDRDVVELLRPALLHIVRNSVVHGIEPPEERARRGKPRVGSVRVDVALKDANVVVVCEDDGAGVDLVDARARLRLSPDAPERQVLEALLAGGASTANQLSELSGRGVGLDVLRDTAERLQGRLDLSNRPSGGLSVRLEFAAQLRSFRGIDLATGDAQVTIPLEEVLGVVRLTPADRARLLDRAEFVHEGKTLPTTSLGRALGLAAASEEPRVAVLVRGRSGPFALVAESIGEVRQALLRALPEHAHTPPFVAGLVLNLLGRPQLVLNCATLSQERPSEFSGRPRARGVPHVLVVDDSLTTRMLEQSILEANGYRVALACSAEEGLVRAHEDAFDLFLVDVEMPGMDGFDFVTRTQTDPRLSRIPAVLVSSRSERADLARGVAVGAKGYVVKHQFDQQEFLSLIERLTGAA